MTGKVGNRISIETERIGQRNREGEVLEVIESAAGVAYRVRWDDGHESTFRPAAGSARFSDAPHDPAEVARP